MKNFRELGISDPILKAIGELNFAKPSEIQEKSIPLVVSGKDILGGSATGSGKTLAFGTGIIQNSDKGAGIQALVLTPTRELAEQVCKELRKFSKYKKMEITPVYGGVSINPQIKRLKTADAVVGTPGRILDHISRQTIDLSQVKILVLDEADRMLDMGFIEDVERIIKSCPKERQTLLFSATMSDDIVYLSRHYLKSPVKINVESYVDPKKLKQIYYDVSDQAKFSVLVHLLKKEKKGSVMVFCNTQRNTDFVARNLKLEGLDATAIHGGFSQDRRNKALEKFHAQNAQILVCTDVAARGLDIKDVSHIYNYDLPKESKQYIHRIGRTARAGKEGIAVNILSPRDHENFQRLFRDFTLDIPKKETPDYKRIKIKWKGQDDRRGGRGGGGHSGGFGVQLQGRGKPRMGTSGHPRRSNSDNSRGGRSGHRKPRRGPPRGGRRRSR